MSLEKEEQERKELLRMMGSSDSRTKITGKVGAKKDDEASIDSGISSLVCHIVFSIAAVRHFRMRLK